MEKLSLKLSPLQLRLVDRVFSIHAGVKGSTPTSDMSE